MHQPVAPASATSQRRQRPPTPELILWTAERLFAVHGIEAVSLRHIARAAGQRSAGAVQYHFGDKAGVVRALFEHRMAAVNDRQLMLYAKLDAEGRQDEPRAAVELLTLPLADELDSASSFLGVLVRVRHYPEEALPHRTVDPDLTMGNRKVGALLAKHVARLPPRLRRLRRNTVTAAVLSALSDRQLAMREGGAQLVPTELFLSDLIDGATAFLTAPTSATTSAIARSRRKA